MQQPPPDAAPAPAPAPAPPQEPLAVANVPRLFVGQLPADATEADLLPLFAAHGEVERVAMVRGPEGRPRGCAMVQFRRWADAEAAAAALHGTTPLPDAPRAAAAAAAAAAAGGAPPPGAAAAAAPRPLVVHFANPRRAPGGGAPPEPAIAPRKLFVGQIPKSASEADLAALFGRFGGVEGVSVLKSKGAHAGCAFVQCASWAAAEAAIAALHDTHRMPGCEHPLVVKFADAKRVDLAAAAGRGRRGGGGGAAGGGGAGGGAAGGPAGAPPHAHLHGGGAPPAHAFHAGHHPHHHPGAEVHLHPHAAAYMGGLHQMGGVPLLHPGMVALHHHHAAMAAAAAAAQQHAARGALPPVGSSDSLADASGGGSVDTAGDHPGSIAPLSGSGDSGASLASGGGGMPHSHSVGSLPSLYAAAPPDGGWSPVPLVPHPHHHHLHPHHLPPGALHPAAAAAMMHAPPPPPPRGRLGRGVSDPAAYAHKLFVGQVPFEAAEADLWPLFAPLGEVLELAVLRAGGRSKGCAFLTYATRAQAAAAVAALNGRPLGGGKKLVVKFAESQRAPAAAKAEAAAAAAEAAAEAEAAAAGGGDAPPPQQPEQPVAAAE